jgi:hypothetical protein
VPAGAASSVRTADGSVLTVDEFGGGRGHIASAARRSRTLVFTLETADGTRSGFVAPTVDAAFDESPVLALDRRSRRPVLIWSRHDGAAMKLAWSRFDGGLWSEARFLTFGPGDDRAPALGTSAAGSYLFWRGVGDSVLYAPLDLETGRFFAAPAALRIPEAARGPRDGGTEAPIPAVQPDGGTDAPVTICSEPPCPRSNGSPGTPHRATARIGTNGGTDAPIIICQDPPCIQTNGEPDVPLGAMAGSSSTIGTSGGTDAPVTICQDPPCPVKINGDPDVPLGAVISSSDSSLYTFSNPGCGSQILVFGSPRGRTLLALEFDGTGRIAPAGNVTVPSGLERTEAVASAGSSFLEAACR